MSGIVSNFAIKLITDMARLEIIFVSAVLAGALISCSGEVLPADGTPEPAIPELGYDVYPYGAGIHTDTEITLTFDSVPSAGNTGCIRILTESGTEVDRIEMEDVAAEVSKMENTSVYRTTMDILGASAGNGKYYRVVNYTPVRISGNSIIIRLHSAVLDFDTGYSIVIDREAIKAEGFEGVETGEWTFHTRPAPDSETDVTVGRQGDTDFRTIQGALDYVCRAGQDAETTIDIRNGTYEEQLYMRGKDNVTLRGMSRSGVILSYANCEDLAYGVGSGTSVRPEPGSEIGRSGGRAVILFENCDNIRFENMTLENSWNGDRNQAEVIYFNSGDGKDRLVMVNCNISSRQDTINAKGYGWFYGCTIEGNVDFIWGSPETVLFENCTLRIADDTDFSSAYIVQCRCLSPLAKGFIFLGCTISAESGVPDGSVYLARSSGEREYYDNVTYIDCRMDSSVAAAGWYSIPAPNPSAGTASRGWKESGSRDTSDNAIDLSGRYSGCHLLTEDECGIYQDRETIFQGAGIDFSLPA